MAPARSIRSYAERRHARHLVQRSPSQPPTVSASSSPSQTAPAGVSLPPHGAAALVGIIVTLSVFILAFAAWKLWVWRVRKRVASLTPDEKSRKPAGLFDAVDEETRFKRTLSGSSTSSSSTVVVVPPTGPKPAFTRERTPAEFKINLAYKPKVVYTAPQEISRNDPPLPNITVSSASGLHISPPPTYVSIPTPALSPRTAASKAPRNSVISSRSSKLPRLVIVESTFTPSLHDELEIREGEILRLLEEYEDEWCLVQRVGPIDAEKGVVPRFCVFDKPDTTSARKSKHIPRLSLANL